MIKLAPQNAIISTALVIAGLLATVGYFAAADAHLDAQWAACDSLPATWQMYTTAYGGLACGLGGLVVADRLVRHTGTMTWVVGASAVAAAVLLLVHGFLVYLLYQPDPGGVFSCAG